MAMLFFMLACLILTGCMVFLVFATVQVLRAKRPRRYGLLALYIVLLVALVAVAIAVLFQVHPMKDSHGFVAHG